MDKFSIQQVQERRNFPKDSSFEILSELFLHKIKCFPLFSAQVIKFFPDWFLGFIKIKNVISIYFTIFPSKYKNILNASSSHSFL
jgi:hypothetical protein